ncbi:MAG: hypothetical protein JW870_12700 [Candidatus Delongbacteria bacterium]|nr:hypothetical protein [Candidatus Delongbacteria bacterium]
MSKKQRTISIGIEEIEEFKNFLKENKDMLSTLGIKTVPELIRVQANLGRHKLIEIVGILGQPVQFPKEYTKKIDEVVKAFGFSSRQELVNKAVLEFLNAYEQAKD